MQKGVPGRTGYTEAERDVWDWPCGASWTSILHEGLPNPPLAWMDRSGTGQEGPFPSLLFNIMLEGLINAIGLKNKRGINIRKN